MKGIKKKEYYRKYSSTLKSVVKLAERRSHENFINKAENKTEATWTLVNELLQKKIPQKAHLKLFQTKNEKEILNDFNWTFIHQCEVVE